MGAAEIVLAGKQMERSDRAYVNAQIQRFFEQLRAEIDEHYKRRREEQYRKEDLAYRADVLESQRGPMWGVRRSLSDKLLYGEELDPDERQMLGLMPEDERLTRSLRKKYLEGLDSGGAMAPGMQAFGRAQGLYQDAPYHQEPQGPADYLNTYARILALRKLHFIPPRHLRSVVGDKMADEILDQVGYDLERDRSLENQSREALISQREAGIALDPTTGLPMGRVGLETFLSGLRKDEAANRNTLEMERDRAKSALRVNEILTSKEFDSLLEMQDLNGVIGILRDVQDTIFARDNPGVENSRRILGELTSRGGQLHPITVLEQASVVAESQARALEAELAQEQDPHQQAILRRRIEGLAKIYAATQRKLEAAEGASFGR